MHKLLIANRGEIAVRVARTARSMGIATVAVHSEPDADALHVRACDEAVGLGGRTPAESYLRADALLEAARRVEADAVHPGYGFLAENAGFARAVIDAGLTWVGPGPEAIAAMGDKLEAKARMAAAGVPLLPSVALAGDDDVAAAGDEVGYPLMVKAAAGGGGKGMRVVREPAELADAVAAARREAAGAFGDDRVFLERYVEAPRHVEVQILGDHHGALVHLFERECSIQRRHQKVIEESPSPVLTAEVRAAMGEAAVAAGRSIGYANAGTVEFITDAAGREFSFLEVNTRLQVEHPVTEEVVRVAGSTQPLDLVRLQLLVAAGEPLPFTQDELRQDGHAIEVRLYAEDPAGGYLPATGTLAGFRPPGDIPGVRWDSGVTQGSVVSSFYDPMLAKVIAWAPSRREAASRLARALERTLLDGVRTNRDLLVAVLRDPAFLAGDTTTGFLEERFPDAESRTFPPSPRQLELAAVVATVGGIAERLAGPRPVASVPPGFSNTGLGADEVVLVGGGRELTVAYGRDGDGWRLAVDGEPVTAVLRSAGAGEVVVEVDGHRLPCRLSHTGDEWHVLLPDGQVSLVEQPRFPRAAAAGEPGATLAPMPGAVVSLHVGEGDEVVAGELLVVVEAMKMEHRITAPHDGTVTRVAVEPGAQVEADDVLVVVEPAAADDA